VGYEFSVVFSVEVNVRQLAVIYTGCTMMSFSSDQMQSHIVSSLFSCKLTKIF